MTRVQKMVLSICAIALINASAFLTNIYPKHVIEFDFPKAPIAMLFNLMYILFAGYFFIIVFKKTKKSSNFKLYKNDILYLILLVFIQIFIDAVLYIINRQLSSEALLMYIIKDLILFAYWFLIYILLVSSEMAVWNNKKRLIVAIVSILVLLGISLFFDIKWTSEINTVAEKYKETAQEVVFVQNRVAFAWELKTFIFETVLFSILIILHFLNIAPTEKENWHTSLTRITKTALRIYAVLVAATILVIVKTQIYNNGFLVAHFNDSHKGDTIAMDFFRNRCELPGFSRVFGEEEKNYYKNNLYIVTNKKTGEEVSFESMIFYPRKNNIEEPGFDAMIYIPSDYVDVGAGEKEIYLFFENILGFHDDEGTPKALVMSDVSASTEYTELTLAAKHLVEQGNVIMFEYLAKYLVKYEPEFIQPYIDRYADGAFSDAEEKVFDNNLYKKEYVIEFAKSLK